MSLLRVERENAIRERLIGRDQSRDLPLAEHLRRSEPMPSVGRPKFAVVAAHHDQRIEKRARLIDLLGEPLRMRWRQIALKRRRLYRAERERRDQ